MGLLWELLQHPDELNAILKVRAASKRITQLPRDPDLAFCYDMLNKVSRSFAIVIQQLGKELRDAVCIFYLVLRALDTVEDDMAIPVETKVPVLLNFYKKIVDPKWTYICGTGHYHVLMEQLACLSRALNGLDAMYSKVILDITKRMGKGMAEFITKEVETVADYDLYCHYVAGLVGIGLSDLFYSSKLEDPVLESLSNSMGLFLQKVNITRDYLEDINEEPAPRMFWPREIWGLYARQLADFKDTADNGAGAVKCLNHLLTDALQHATDSLTYLARLKDVSVFKFCAIPQIMAMGTIDVCYDNIKVFQGVVKMRKGLSARVMDGTDTMVDVADYFFRFASSIEAKIDPADPNAALTRERLEGIKRKCQEFGPMPEPGLNVTMDTDISTRVVLWLVFLAYVSYVFDGGRLWGDFGLLRSSGAGLADSSSDPSVLVQQVLALLLLLLSTWLLFLKRSH